MPGFNRQNEPSNPPVTRSAPVTSSPNGSASFKAKNRIKFVPPQLDRLAGTSTQASRENPIRLLIRDVGVLLSMLKYLPFLILPIRTKDNSAELYPSLGGIRDIVLQSWLFFAELTILICAPAALMILPGILTLFATAAACLVIYIVSWPMQGPRIVFSRMDDATIRYAKKHDHERWLFVNGCAVGHRGLQQNIDRLAKTFGRPVIGIHNQSYGLIADLIECLIQRCLAFNTMDVRIAYDYVKACLLDPTVSKVVLLAHSQGGIIASLVMDHLFADLSPETISKLEIYTFGNAASHFNNPRLTDYSTSSLPPFPPPYCIPHIEHYVNEHDMLPCWGVLYNVTRILDNRYSGKVFIRMAATGHLFNQHYMDAMFPLNASLASTFLDQVVDVDEKLAMRRESTAVQQVAVMRKESTKQCPNTNGGNRERMPVGAVINGEKDVREGLLIDFVESGTGAEARGKTVRQLSRLCRYADGGSPLD